MKRKLLLLSFITVGLLTSAAASAQPTPVRESRGVSVSHTEALDLAPWANDAQGRQLRIRKFVVQPGGVIGLHSHDDRPDASYLVQGELVEYREGGFAERRPADTVHMAGKVTHWVANEGTVPAVLIVVDYFKP